MEENTNTLPATYQQPAPAPAPVPSYFTDLTAFEAGQRMARLLASSQLVPAQFQENIPDTLIALEMAARTGSSPLAVMQSMYVVHGRPGWGAAFVIASINACGRFSPLRYEEDGEGDDAGCVAWAVERSTGEVLRGARISIATAKAEGWYARNGSKWKTMGQQMLRYRAATFFARAYAPDILMGMRTDDELRDIGPAADAPAPRRAADEATATPATPARAIDAMIDAREREQADLVAAAAAPAEVIEAAPEPPKPEPDDNLPPQLRKYLKAKGEKPRPVPPAKAKPEQAALPMPETPAAQPDALSRNAAMQRFLLDLAGKEGLSELRWWKERNEQKLIEELGEDSEEFQAVIADWMDKVSALERKLKK